MEEQKKTGKGGLVAIIIILLLIICGMGAFIFINKDKLFTTEKSKKETTEKVTKENTKLEITSEIKEKLEKFVNVGTTADVGYGTYSYFVDGATGLTDKIKYRMTNTVIYKIEKKYTANVTLSTDDINNLVGEKPSATEPVDTVKISDFDNTYKELFGETANYEISDLSESGCPLPWAINKEKGLLYYFHRCGGTFGADFEKSITSIDNDDNYYYVHEELSETPYGSTETKKTKLLWKFDKDLNFVSTEKE